MKLLIVTNGKFDDAVLFNKRVDQMRHTLDHCDIIMLVRKEKYDLIHDNPDQATHNELELVIGYRFFCDDHQVAFPHVTFETYLEPITFEAARILIRPSDCVLIFWDGEDLNVRNIISACSEADMHYVVVNYRPKTQQS